MKKLLAIFFTSLLALHYAGYYLAFLALNQKIEKSWEVRFEENRFDSDLIKEMTLPISFPYLHDQSEYINVDELMEIDGKVYRILKKRYEKGTLHLIYLNDKDKESIESLYQKWADDMHNKSKSAQNTATFNHTIDKHYINLDLDFSFRPGEITEANHNTPYINNFNDICLEAVIPPPKYS